MRDLHERYKLMFENYQERFSRMENIDSAISFNFNDKYKYLTNELEFHTYSDKKLTVKADLVYISRKKDSILLIEETLDPSSFNKEKQLVGYSNITKEMRRSITHSDLTPNLDVFLVFPADFRKAGLEIYNKSKKEFPSKYGKDVGITLWTYTSTMKKLTCVGGEFSNSMKTTPSELIMKGYPTLRILKNADPVSLLHFIVRTAIQKEYGKSEGLISFNKDKLEEWLHRYDLVNTSKWQDAISVGAKCGWLDDVSIEQLTGVIKYTKNNPASLRISKMLLNDFFETIKKDVDEEQSLLMDFDEDDED